jgi:ubiquinone/menaquinone biosynthesis C-methylase UbiE
MPRSPGYVSAEYLQTVARQMASIKERSHELLCLAAGQSVLDVGCGPATDTVALASRVAPGGRVVGVDVDDEMIAKARAVATDAKLSDVVEHVMGDVRGLPFQDAAFDACRAERLLQVLPPSHQPASVVREMVRVVRPGGRVLLADTDWQSASVDHSNFELERRLMHFFATRMRPNGSAGRQLYRLLAEAGCVDLAIDAFAHVILDADQTPFGDWLRREALGAGVAKEDEMDSWAAELAERTRRGTFYCSVGYVLVVGTVQR